MAAASNFRLWDSRFQAKINSEVIKKKNCYLFTLYLGFGVIFNFYTQTETKILTNDLPAAAQIQLNKKYDKYKVNSIVKNNNKGDKNSYEIEIQKKNRLVFLGLDSNGTLLNKRTSKIYTFDGTEPIQRIHDEPPSIHEHNHRH